jgi:hypothetical protein
MPSPHDTVTELAVKRRTRRASSAAAGGCAELLPSSAITAETWDVCCWEHLCLQQKAASTSWGACRVE